MYPSYFWYGFLLFVIFSISIDLIITSKRTDKQSLKQSLLTALIWVIFAAILGIIIYKYAGYKQALEFYTAYLIELSLSADNIFVFIIIFKYFRIELKYQHKLLFWGIFGAIILRFAMISGGLFLVQKFDWIFLFFGLLLVYSGFKLLKLEEHSDEKTKNNFLITFCTKYLNFTDEIQGDKWTIYKEGKRYFTPLVLALILIEKADVVFALDSVPAVLAISKESFIVFSSNIFAILGLRSMYFILANAVQKFTYLKYGITIILIYIGIKMVLTTFSLYIPTTISLVVIVISVITAILLSIFYPIKK